MFPFTTGSSRVIYSSRLMWVSLSESIFFNYHLSPKAKLILILVVPRFDCQHLIWFQFVFSHFECFHWHQDMSRLFEPLANGFYVEIHLLITQCPLFESFFYFWPFMWLLQGHKKLFLPSVPKFIWNMLDSSPVLATVNICSSKFTRRRHNYFTLHCQQIWWTDWV